MRSGGGPFVNLFFRGPISRLSQSWWESTSHPLEGNKNRFGEQLGLLPERLSCTVRAQMSARIQIQVDQSESLHQHRPAVHTGGSEVRRALHDPHVLNVARVPSRLLISNLTTITRTHRRTEAHIMQTSLLRSAEQNPLWAVRYQGSDLIRRGPPHIWPELR